MVSINLVDSAPNIYIYLSTEKMLSVFLDLNLLFVLVVVAFPGPWCFS